MTRTILKRLLVICILASVQEIVAQDPSSRTVRLNVTAIREGGSITDLAPDVLVLKENGKVQRIQSFERPTASVSWCLLMDTSGSMVGQISQAQALAIAVVNAIPATDEVCVFHFSDEPYLDAKLTQSRPEVQRGLMMRTDARGTSKLRDAGMEAVRYLAREAKNEKKLIVIISDGLDNKSKVKRDFLTAALLESNILVYALAQSGNVDVSEVGAAAKELNMLTEDTGGFAFHGETFANLQRYAERIVREVQSQYLLTYSPANQNLDQKFRSITLTIEGPKKKEIQVRTKSGYYATPTGFK